MDKKEIKDQLIEIHTQEAKRHVQKIRQSFRWKVGNAFARLIEMILFRKKEKLSIDFLEEHLQTIEQLTIQVHKNRIESQRSILFKDSHKTIFLVSDTNIETSVFGDTHVANDFKLALEEIYPNLACSLIDYKQATGVEDFDILINMLWDASLPHFDVAKKPVKIGWVRNYPDRWVTNPSFLKYDLFLCSSKKIQQYIQKHTQVPVYLFPIAANINRFNIDDAKTISNKIVFVGNKWKESRHIENYLKKSNSKKLSVEVYGKGWEDKAFSEVAKGLISNAEIPKLYQQTHIILDAANETTKLWESLNSRVFNAIASKKIVLTDSDEATQLFKYPIPVYQNVEELHKKIDEFSDNLVAYSTVSNYLFEELKQHHTYAHRAHNLQLILAPKLKIAIKIAPKKEQQKHFGDWYFAQALSKVFKKYGHHTKIDVYEDWYTAQTQHADLVITLRGIKAFQPLEQQTNFLWIISHPEDVSLQEMQQYQHCFLASDYHYQKLNTQQITNLSVLHQCTDTEVFVKKASYKKNKKLLFLGMILMFMEWVGNNLFR